MRALVTGASGFLGRYLVDELARRGDGVVALARPGSASGDALDAAGYEVERLDLRRPGDRLPGLLAEADVVYHLAAGVTGGWRATFDTNVTATENLVEAIRAANFPGRLVHVSSFSVYGLNQVAPGSLVNESSPVEPEPWRRDDYAWTKALQERVVRRLEGMGPELVVVRPGTIYGKERRFHFRLGRPLGDDALLLLGGWNPLPLTYVENTVSLIAECGRHPEAPGQVFNAVDTGDVTQFAYVRRWRQGPHGPSRVIPFPLFVLRLAGRGLVQARNHTKGRLSPPAFLDPYIMEPTLRRLRWAPSRAENVLGWRPPVPLEEAFRRTFS